MPHFYRALRCLLSPLLRAACFLVAFATAAQAQVQLAGPGQASSVRTVLNADGTLRPGAQGAFNTTAYQLSQGKGGQPVLRPAATGWNALGGGTPGRQNGVEGDILALAVAGGTVYVGSSFTQAGGAAANYVAQWDSATWSSLGAGPANGYGGQQQGRHQRSSEQPGYRPGQRGE